MSSKQPSIFPKLSTSVFSKGLKHFSNDELRQILSSEDRVYSLIMDCPILERLADEKENLIAKNTRLAEHSLQRERELQQAREKLYQSERVLGSKTHECERLEEQHDMKTAGSISQLHGLMGRLNLAADKEDDELEKVVDDFTHGYCDIVTFIDLYVAKRTKINLKLIKAEKLKQSISKSGPAHQHNFL